MTQNQRIAALRSLILKAKHAYYYSGEPIMGDAEYDALEDELRQLSPGDAVLALVGSPVPLDAMLTKARHSIPMGSQSKVNSEDEFRAWWDKSGTQAVHASLKGDGASAAAYYRDGQLVQAISRGDGTTGEDITANALRFKGLPAWVGGQAGDGAGFSGAVRFEVILTVSDWTAIDPARSKNPRNAGTGIMGRKNGHQSDCLTIFAFDIDEVRDSASVSFATETEKTARLVELGFNVIPSQRCTSAEEAVGYFRQIAQDRDTLPIWIDGVVMKLDDIAAQRDLGVTSGRPKGQVAWKFDSSGAETVLEDVVISGGHTGGLYPTGQLRPVEIGGTTVSNVSLANFDEIARLDVAIGDSVWVVKANDIIPKIIRVTERSITRRAILTPVACPFCGGEVGRRRTSGGDDGVMIVCQNGLCEKKSTGKIRRWISSLDILGIGDGILEAMLERFALEDAASLYTLTERVAELADLVINADKEIRLGDKRAQSIIDAIDATRALTLQQFLGSLGLDYLGKRRVELMMKAAAGGLDTLDDWQSGRLRDAAFASAAGVPGIGSQIQDGIDAMGPVIARLLTAGIEVLPPQPRDDAAAQDAAPRQTLCISGKLHSGKKKADYEAPLRAVGIELVDDVSKGLSYLVLADPTSTSSKADKARKLGVEVISEDQLLALLQAEAPVAAAAPASPPAPVAAPVKPHNPNPPVAPQVTPAAQPPAAAATPATRTLCISGKLHSGKKKADYEAPLRAVAIDLVDDVSKGLSYLVLADPDSTSSKADKARKLGVSVISEDELMALCSQTGSTAEPAARRAVRSESVVAQLTEAQTLRTKLLSQLLPVLAPAPNKKTKKKEPRDPFLQTLELSAEGFTPVVQSIPVAEVDRASSMLAGPFFVSAENPIPTRQGGMLLPVIQLDLRQISDLCEVDIGDGVLQLWCDPNWENESRQFIRVIPRSEIESQSVLPFEFIENSESENCPLPQDLIFSPSREEVRVITGAESTGWHAQASYFDVYSEDISEDLYGEIADDLQRFKELTNLKNSLHLFGSFYPIQYSAADVGLNSLVHFPVWGSSGNAQVFYENAPEGVRFVFQESLR